MGQSRNENILENILGAQNPLGEPQSREEALLMQILEQGGGGGSSTLAGLTDVSVTSPSNKQILKYNGETGKWENDNIENEIELSKTAGPSSVVSFISETDMPYKSVLVNIEATGGNGTPDNPNPIVGYTEANITRCGVNLVNPDNLETGWLLTDGTVDTSYANYKTTDFIPVIPSSTLYITPTGSSRCKFYDANKQPITNAFDGNIGGIVGQTFTVTNDTHYIRKTVTTANVSTFGINLPSTESEFIPYNGQTYTIAFGQTVYGGVLDVTRGKLHVTWAELNSLGSLNWGGSNGKFYSTSLASVIKKGTTGDFDHVMCSIFEAANVGSLGSLNNYQMSVDTSGNIQIRDDDYTNNTLFANAMIDVKLYYELATPFDIDLTPEVISAIVGENNVFADCGETTVGYYTSIGESIHDLVEESVKFWTDISGTLEAGETEITLTSSAITTSSTIEVFNNLDVPYVSKELSAGSITLTFDAQESDMSVKVRVS